MSTSQPAISVASLKYIRPQTLASELLNNPDTIAVVDVRDNDYIGGHIKDSIHAPVDQLDIRIPELLRTLRNKEKVVFHCMLSQQRGPSAALRYARAKAGEAAREQKDAEVERKDDEGEAGEVMVRKIGGQEICVLEGGFSQWQSRYGEDKKLTEGYVKELWESVLG